MLKLHTFPHLGRVCQRSSCAPRDVRWRRCGRLFAFEGTGKQNCVQHYHFLNRPETNKTFTPIEENAAEHLDRNGQLGKMFYFDAQIHNGSYCKVVPHQKPLCLALGQSCAFSTARNVRRRRVLQDNDDSAPKNDALITLLLRSYGESSPEEVPVRLVSNSIDKATGETNNLMELTTLLGALQYARSKSLDLLGVATDQKPPVIRALDYKKWEYDAKKHAVRKNREKAPLEHNGDESVVEARRSSSKALVTKEFRFKVGIADRDLQRKISDMKKYLIKKHPCQVSISSNYAHLMRNSKVVEETYMMIYDSVENIAREPIHIKYGLDHSEEYKKYCAVIFQPK